MNWFYLIFFILIIGCGYPDIDSVPSFKNITITNEEEVDLCNFTNNGNKEISECINKIKDNE